MCIYIIIEIVNNKHFLHFQCRAWLTHHFKISGDCDPTSNEVHVDKVDLKDIFADYKADMEGSFNDSGRAVLGYSRFCWLIQYAFPHVKIRDYRTVSRILLLNR